MNVESWPETTLIQVCVSVIDCVNKTAPVTQSKTPFRMIRTTNVRNGVVDFDNVRYVSEDTFKKWTRRAVPQKGDVILTREAPLGEVGILDNPNVQVFLGQRLMQYRTNPEKLYNYFLLYSLQERYMQSQLHAAGSGSTVEHIRVADAENLKIRLPKLCTQIKIGEMLKAYDDLIQNNNRRIAILEEMAQSIYKEWFVNFRFPGHDNCRFKNSNIGQIPDGWDIKSAADVVNINPRTRLLKEGTKPFVPMPSLSQTSMVISNIEERTGNGGTKFKNGDTLFARITPCLQNGKIGYVQFLNDENPIGFGSTEFIVLREKLLHSEYIYCLARSLNFRNHAINSMAGADGRQRVKPDCFSSYFLAVPEKEYLDKFSILIKPLFEQIFNLHTKNQNLKKQRDMLLPKLISGEIKL